MTAMGSVPVVQVMVVLGCIVPHLLLILFDRNSPLTTTVVLVILLTKLLADMMLYRNVNSVTF